MGKLIGQDEKVVFFKLPTHIMAKSKHYDKTQFEPIKIINHYRLDFNTGNVLKYILRAGKKENNTRLSDLEKARDYINYEIEWEKLNTKNK